VIIEANKAIPTAIPMVLASYTLCLAFTPRFMAFYISSHTKTSTRSCCQFQHNRPRGTCNSDCEMRCRTSVGPYTCTNPRFRADSMYYLPKNKSQFQL